MKQIQFIFVIKIFNLAGKREMLRDIVVVFFYIHTSNQCMIMIQCQGQAEERRKIEGYHTGKNEHIKV